MEKKEDDFYIQLSCIFIYCFAVVKLEYNSFLTIWNDYEINGYKPIRE